MPRCQKGYPPHAAAARTFPELFQALSRSWPLAGLAAEDRGWGPDEYADHLFGLARKVVARLPGFDLWENEHLPRALMAAMKRFDLAGPWSFERLFDRTFAQRLGRARARAAEDAYKEARRGRRVAAVRRRRDTPDYVLEATFQRWGRRMVARAAPYLEAEVRAYVAMRLAPASDRPVQDIARHLGVTKAYLRNRYAGHKLGAIAQRALAEAVRAMPYDHVQRLARHLSVTAGLPDHWVAGLLGGVAVKVDASVPLMEEGPLVAFLGWEGEENPAGAPDSLAPPPEVRSR